MIGASGGIGAALHRAFSARGAQVIALSRSQNGLDVTDEESVAHHLGTVEGPIDGLFVTTGALEIDGHPPEKALRQITKQAMLAQFALHTVGPALCLKHGVRLLPRDRRAIMAVLSARVGSIGDNRLGGWHSYRASKAALNQIVRGTAIELARTHPGALCVALHPGTVATRFTEKYLHRHPSVSPDEAGQALLGVMDRLLPAQSGGFFDYAGKEIAW